jgi:hypothetical protein
MKQIGVDCPSCRTSFHVAEQYAGKRGRCPHCRELLQVPSSAAEPGPEIRAVEPGEGETYALENAPTAAASASACWRSRPAARPGDRLIGPHRRILGRLAATVEAVEKVVGLAPLSADRSG